MPSRHLLAALTLASAALSADAAAQAPADEVKVALEPVGGSGISGTAVLQGRGRETDFSLTLKAQDPAKQRQEYDVWLREGTCANPGRKVEDVEDLRADGRTEHEDEDIALADILETDHILEVRVENRDEVVACGAVKH